MRGFWGVVGVALLAVGLAGGCGGTNTSVQGPTGATIINLAPSGVVFGGQDFTLTVLASQFNPFLQTSVIQWNGQTLATTAVNNTTLTAVVPASLIAKAGTAFVNTHTPQSGSGQNGLSNSLAFLIYGSPNPVPTLTSISPDTTTACGTKCTNVSLKITLTGTNFLPSSNNGGSSVTIADAATPNQQPSAVQVTSITDTKLTAVIPGTFLQYPDTARISVVNPPSGICLVNCPDLGGGRTDPLPLTIGGGTGNSTSASEASEETPAISQDGRYVAFSAEQDGVNQVLLRDTCVGAPNGCTPGTRIISAASDGSVGNAESHSPAMSADGRYVVFSSAATNLVEGAGAGKQVYLRDTCVGAEASCKAATSLISTDTEGRLTGTESVLPSISSSGRFVAFVAVTPSAETNGAKKPAAPASSANSGLRQVFIRDTCLGASNCTPKTTRISMQPGDTPADSTKPAGPALSGLAKQVALAGGKSSTVFTKTVPVDDQVFLAVPGEPK